MSGLDCTCFEQHNSSNLCDVFGKKKALRKEKLAVRRCLDPEFRSKADNAICSAILSLLEKHTFPSVVAYMTDGTEPNLAPVLKHVLLTPGNQLFLPRFESDGVYRIVQVFDLNFSASKWGIPEPSADAPSAAEKDLDSALWLVPGVAFDDAGHRLGRGKGIYDRLLTGTRLRAGIFYECQRCKEIPFEPHDRPMDLIVTEKGIFNTANQICGGEMISSANHHPNTD